MKESIIYKFGKRVRSLRKENKLTQEQLAGLSRISLKYIQKIEGKHPPDIGLEYLEKLAKAFGIPAWKLLKIE